MLSSVYQITTLPLTPPAMVKGYMVFY